MALLRTIISHLRTAFAMDTRSLALARVWIALAILADLEQKSRFLQAFYTDQGLLPRSALATQFYQPYFFSLHMASGEAWFQIALFLFAALCALGLLLGYKTRLMTFVSWILLISLQARNLPILNAGDGILRLFLFWSMFLPMGAHWSVDRALTPDTPPPTRVTTVATVGWILQLVSIYWVTMALRQSPEWWEAGTAIYYALQLEQLTTVFGAWVAGQPLWFLQILTWTTVSLELGAPLLLLLPQKQGIFRLLGCLGGIALHLGIFLMMHIGVFPFIAMIGWVALFPPLLWDTLRTYLPYTKGQLTLWYDPDCGFCRKTVALLRTFLFLQADIRPASENAIIEKDMHEHNSWVVETDIGEKTFGWNGISTVLRHSPLLFWLAPLSAFSMVHRWGSALYRWIANHRYLLGRVTQYLTFRPQRWTPSITGSLTAFLCIVLTLIWNIQTLRVIEVPEPVEASVLALRLDQYWNMFAPFPLKEDGWYVVPGTLVDGTTIDLLHGDRTGPVSFAKPANLSTSFPTESWRKYFLNLWLPDYEQYRAFYAEYHCQRWNTRHEGDQRLKTLFIHYVKETTPPPEQRGSETQEQLTLWEWHCGGVEDKGA